MLHRAVLGRGADLVLVHGWGMNGAVWNGLAEALARTFRVWILDLPGHGHSPHLPERSRLADWAAACLARVPEGAIWVGWSLGGSIALEAALTAPQRLRGLCLITSTPRFLQAPDWPHAMPEATLTQFRNQLTQDPAATLERFLALQVKGNDSARKVLRGLRRRLADRPAADARALDTGLDLLRTTDLRPRLAELALPSLWLFGRRDTLVPWRWSTELARLLPGARGRLIEGAAHIPFLSHPAPSLALLTAFVQGLP
jgi:pimeloyl-[acyl-carrier protein] methyl ester esterase